MNRFSSRARVMAGVLAATVATAAFVVMVEIASAHKSTVRTQIRFVPSSAPDTPGAFEIHIRSRSSACYRRVPVRLVRDGRIVFANFTNARGVVVSPRDDKPRAFGEEFAGSTVEVRRRTTRRSRGHRHGCAGARRIFQPPQ